MNPTAYAVRLGLDRGWREVRHSLASPQDWSFNIFFAVVFVVVLYFQRNSSIEGTSVSLAMATLPSVLGMMVAFNGFAGPAGSLTVEREDGTLLRAKAVPHGMIGYLVGRILSVSSQAVLGLLVILVPGLFLVPELAEAGPAGWLTLVWVIMLGLLATLPYGAILGSLTKSPNALFAFVMLPTMMLASISGIFYPISTLPGWVQGIAQVFPVYWLGLGTRSALLPDAAAAAEIGESWRTLETVGVLGAWAIVGFLLAPVILRRMARRESGAAMEERKQRAIQRYSG